MELALREAAGPLGASFSACSLCFFNASLRQGRSARRYLRFYFCFASQSASLPLTLRLRGWG